MTDDSQELPRNVNATPVTSVIQRLTAGTMTKAKMSNTIKIGRPRMIAT